MDVVVRLDDTAVHARISSGDTGSWARRLTPGDRVIDLVPPGRRHALRGRGRPHRRRRSGRRARARWRRVRPSRGRRGADAHDHRHRRPTPRPASTPARPPARSPSRSGSSSSSARSATSSSARWCGCSPRRSPTAPRATARRSRPTGIGRTIAYTIGLALGSLAIALVLGTFLAWAATRLPPRLRILRVIPVLPIVVPAIASVVGWAFLLSPRPGYLNAALRNAAVVVGPRGGPDRHLHDAVDRDHHRHRADRVRLPLRRAGFENISAEHLEAAQVAGSSQLGVFFRVTLPLLRPTLLYGGGVALLLGLGQFTGPLLLGPHRRHRRRSPPRSTADMTPDPGPVRHRRRPRLDAARVRRDRRRHAEGAAAGPQAVRHPRRQGVPRPGPPVEAGRRRPRRLHVHRHRAAGQRARSSCRCRKFWSADIDVGRLHARQLPRRSSRSPTSPTPIYNSVTISLLAVLICLPLGFVAASIILQRQALRPAARRRRLPRRHPPRRPRRAVRRRLPPDLHRGTVRALRHPLGHRPRLRHADAAVRHPHAARRPSSRSARATSKRRGSAARA